MIEIKEISKKRIINESRMMGLEIRYFVGDKKWMNI
jgi:hypothetical protein